MNKKTYITKITVSGIKNIEKPVTLNFYTKTIGNSLVTKYRNIKAIYGPNGSGKSAIIHALDIYQKLSFLKNYLQQDLNKAFLNEIINKSTNELMISIDFLFYNYEDKAILGCYKHTIVLHNYNGEVVIRKEEYLKKQGNFDSTMLLIDNGVVIEKTLDDTLTNKMTNLLNTRSAFNILLHSLFDPKRAMKSDDFESIDAVIEPFANLIFSLHIKTEFEDQHALYTYKISSDKKKENVSVQTKSIERKSMYSKRILKTEQNKYDQHLARLTKFLKLFKNDLYEINYDFIEDAEYLVVEPHIKYSKYRVHFEFESNGIKKLIELFDLFSSAVSGDIVFIDELDSNINDVYLTKLLTYFNQELTGQLVFTTHNISPMDVLKKNKFAIDFLNENQKIKTWTITGNANPIKSYQKGLIKGLPFNISEYDFIGIFSEEE